MSLSAPQIIVSLVNDLIDWYEHQDSQNPLWYPSNTAESRAGQGGRGTGLARSIVPLQQLPARLAPVDRALNLMPEEFSCALAHRHLGTYATYSLETNLSRSTWEKRCDAGYWYISGVVQAHLDREEG